MTRALEAIYEDGVLRPLVDPGLPEHQRVFIQLSDPLEGAETETWQGVYGFSPEEIEEVERLVFE